MHMPPQQGMRPAKFSSADSIPVTYVVSVLAATNSEFVTYPLDLTKTRLQIQGEMADKAMQKAPYRGMFATAMGIVREEGFFSLWRGMTPAIYRHVVYSGVRIVMYDSLRKRFSDQDVANTLPLWKAALCGIVSGCTAQWLASPADLVKVQIQMEGRRRLMGLEARVHGTYHAFREIVRRGGVTSLWKGSLPNVQRAAMVNLGDLTTYDVAKRFIMRKTNLPDSPTVHILSSICAGFAAAILGTPADVIKTRVMNQPTDEHGRGLHYRGAIDCFSQALKKEGFFALYKGFLPCWLRMAPWSLTFWLSFEHIRKIIGASSY
ncbi:mitochondrial uncoupling protein 4 isoform X2 [Hermetia illucens]|nr:mitochondrial uncoupling protein 4 isoform X2 [Hermetia illucens]